MLLCVIMASTRHCVGASTYWNPFARVREAFFFFFSTRPSADRMQFYYWNCLLMIPNYPVEHSGEGQFQASNLCCNHRGNHTCNTAVAFTSQQHKQKARESESRVWVKKKNVKSVWEFSRNMEGSVRCQVEKRETLVEKLRLILKISIS